MRLTILLSVLLLSAYCFGQQAPSSKPLRPTLEVITVDPGTGHVTLEWTAPVFNPLHPSPDGYVIYRRFTDALNSLLFAIDTVIASQTTYTDTDIDANAERVSYRVASVAQTETSDQTVEHYSSFITLSYDSCGNKVDIDWEHYVGWSSIESYHIYVGENPNWDELSRESTIEGFRNRHSFPAEEHKQYYVYVEAEQRDDSLISRSNLAVINTRVATPPQFLSIDSIIAHDHHREIFYSIDPDSEIRTFDLTRWSRPDSIIAHLSRRQFTNISMSEGVFSDTTDSWAARTQAFYYKVDAIDGCRRVKRVSNLSNSIVIRVIPRRLRVEVQWDTLHTQSVDNSTRYKVYRIGYRNGEALMSQIQDIENPTTTSITDNLSPLQGEGFLSIFCYYVEGTETAPNGDQIVLSRSRTVCVEATPDIVMPNAIDPMSSIERFGMKRSKLEPIISFDSEYTLTVYNRWGGIVYQGRNDGWDGRLSDGSFAKEGAYVYRLEVHREGGRSIVDTGHVTVVYEKTQ